MGDSNSEDVGFRYEWSSIEFTTTNWSYHVKKDKPLQFRLLGLIRRELTTDENAERVHHYHAFENAQHTNMFFPTLAEAKAWVVACTMGAKP